MLKILLFPFSLLYGLAVFVRNKFYDWKIFRTTEFDIPVISVGNLSAGGTGKTPMIQYLVALLDEFYKVGTLSRGYRRKTTGFIIVKENSTAAAVGDEPLEIKRKFPSALVAVGEDRMLAIPEMISEEPELQVILMDDAFQHRAVKAGLNILLTPFDSPFYNDWLLPYGRLREWKGGAARADVVIVTRTPETITKQQQQEVMNKTNRYSSAPVFFSSLIYGKAYSLFDSSAKQFQISPARLSHSGGDFRFQILLLCGIANPDSLKKYLVNEGCSVHPMFFSDHYSFRQNDLEKLLEKWNTIHAERKIILTTEKDATRLMGFKDWFVAHQLDVWVLPIETEFSEDDKNRFNKLIFDFVKQKINNG